jgi:hypothetical protein
MHVHAGLGGSINQSEGIFAGPTVSRESGDGDVDELMRSTAASGSNVQSWN